MKAVRFIDGQVAVDADVAEPVIRDGEALIDLRLAGICATDLELLQGYADFQGIPGHEFVGVVGACSDPAWVGRRVVGSINIGCGDCEECRSRGPSHCAQRRVLGIRGQDGAFAESFVLPLSNLYAVPDSVSEAQAVFVEPLAAAHQVLAQLREHHPVLLAYPLAVLGAGRLGLLVAQVLADAGSEVTVLGRREETLALPRELGLKTGLSKDQADRSFSVVVDTTGSAAGLDKALNLVRPRGAVMLKSSFKTPPAVDLSRLVINEIALLGSRCGDFAAALELLEQGRVKVAPLIEARYSLEDAEQALTHAARPGVRKVLLTL